MIDKARSRQEGGSGIGFIFGNKILNFHHSKLHIESEENVGTIVSFELKEAGKKMRRIENIVSIFCSCYHD